MAKYNKNRFGSIVLKDETGNNFTITKKEQAELKKYVKRANQRRYDRSEKYYDISRYQANMKGISKEAYRNLLEVKGFITEKYSSAFTQFKSKADFKDYIKELKQVTKRGYGNERIEKIRESMLKRIDENYGNLGKDLAEKITSLNDGELLSLYVNNDDIIMDLYGSDIGDDVIGELATKTLSNINIGLQNSRRKR